LGIVEKLSAGRVLIHTAVRNLEDMVRVQLGKLRLDRLTGFLEARIR